MKTLDERFPFASKMAKPSPWFAGRERETKALALSLGMGRMRNVAIIGPAGSGKTELARAAASRLEAAGLASVYEISPAKMLKGAKWISVFETALTDLIDAAIKEEAETKRRVVLFIDEFHTLIGCGSSECAGGGGSKPMDAANILKPYLADGLIAVWGATTEEEADRAFAGEEAFKRRFRALRLKELPHDEATEALMAFAKISKAEAESELARCGSLDKALASLDAKRAGLMAGADGEAWAVASLLESW